MKRMTIHEAQKMVSAIEQVKRNLAMMIEQSDALYRSLNQYADISEEMENTHDADILKDYGNMIFSIQQEVITYQRMFNDTTKRSYELMRLKEE